MMTARAPLPYANVRRSLPKFAWLPSSKIEYAYYCVLIYSLMAVYLGIHMPLITSVVMLILAWQCYIGLGPEAKQVYAPLVWLFASGISLMLVQVIIHEDSILSDTNRAFINWMLAFVVVQSLSVRLGFLHRLAFCLFLLGLIALPHLAFQDVGYERARIDVPLSGHLTNPVGLAEWFGFCSVYFAIYGLERPTRSITRVLSWVAAISCLFVIGLTVSRGPLLGCALAITVGFRRLLARGFVPAFILIIAVGITFESGLFDKVAERYAERGTEDTGREVLWPAVIERIYATPFVGVGASNVATYVPESGKSIASPHNSFLYFALSSGIVPAAFYLIFWIKTGWRNLAFSKRSLDDAFRLPLLIFTFVTVMLGDTGFMSPWALPALSFATGNNIFSSRSKRRFVRRPERPQTLRTPRDHSQAMDSIRRS